MNKNEFIEWLIREQVFYREKWFNFCIEGNKGMCDYLAGKIATLNEILVFTKKGDFDDIHSN